MKVGELKGEWTEDSWGPVPPSFNPNYDPRAKEAHDKTIASLVEDGWYGKYSRSEIKAEFRKRYDERLQQT